MSIAVWNTIRFAQQRVPFDRLFLLGRVVLGDHALVAEPGSRRRTRCRPRPCWWPRSPVPAAPSRRGTAAAPRSASRARPPGTPCRSGFCASSTTIGASASPKTLCIVKSPKRAVVASRSAEFDEERRTCACSIAWRRPLEEHDCELQLSNHFNRAGPLVPEIGVIAAGGVNPRIERRCF